MPQFQVTYFVGFDRDDWNKLELTASDKEEARIKAIDIIPRDCRIKKIEEKDTPFRELTQSQKAERMPHLFGDVEPYDMWNIKDAFQDICDRADKIIQTNKKMEQTKIQNITPQGTFEFKGKTFHKFDVILENGLVGEVNAMTADKWKEGDECVVVDQTSSKWGLRLKLDKPGFAGGSPSAKGGSTDVQGIVASWAVGCAMQAAGDPFQQGYDDIVLQLARIALSARKVIKEEVEV
jgi:hypothetical protein